MIDWLSADCQRKKRQCDKLNQFVRYSNTPVGQSALEQSRTCLCEQVEERIGRELGSEEMDIIWRAFWNGLCHGVRTCVDAQLEIEDCPDSA